MRINSEHEPKQPGKVGRPRLLEPTPINPSVGLHLRSLREKQRLSVKEAAEELGITPGFLSYVELGRRQAKRDLIVKCAKIYHVAEEHLLELIGQRDPLENLIPLKNIQWAFDVVVRHPNCNHVEMMTIIERAADATTKAVVVALFCRRMGFVLLRPQEQQRTEQWLGLSFETMRQERSGKRIEEMLAISAARHYSDEEDVKSFFVSAYLFNARIFPRRDEQDLQPPSEEPFGEVDQLEPEHEDDEANFLDFGGDGNLMFRFLPGEEGLLIWKGTREEKREQIINFLPKDVTKPFVQRWREIRRAAIHRTQIEARKSHKAKGNQKEKKTP